MADKIDEQMWQECLQAVPRRPIPDQALPFRAGKVDGLQVVIVDGDKVKIKSDMDFVEAGNGYRWKFIPKSEIWLDDDIAFHDWPFNAYHEAMEVRLMKGGLSYDPAHARCNAVERQLRLRMAHGAPGSNA